MINVARTELAADAEGGVFLHCTKLVAAGETEYGGVIAAGDSDGHLLGVDAAEAVADLDGEHFVVSLAGLQRLHGTGNAIGAVGQGVSPLTGAVDGDGTVSAGIGPGDAPGGGGRMIDVARAELAADAEAAVLLHRADIVARREAEYGRIVAAGDGDSHLLGVDATEAIADLEGEHFIVSLAGLQ